jgi:hypothetical protein
MPSALTGNTSGLASATSPGLVGITTQTFAGLKTLQSGANIATQGTGTAIASPNIGYLYTTSSLGQALGASGASVNVVTFTLPVAGVWDVYGYAVIQTGTVFTAATPNRVLICVSTVSAALQAPLNSAPITAVASSGTGFCISGLTRLNVTSTATSYYVVYRIDTYSANTGSTVDAYVYARLVG